MKKRRTIYTKSRNTPNFMLDVKEKVPCKSHLKNSYKSANAKVHRNDTKVTERRVWCVKFRDKKAIIALLKISARK